MNAAVSNSIMDISGILILIFSALFILGIIWRVEKKLDTAYKLFFLAIISILFSKVMGYSLFFGLAYKESIASASGFLFSLFLLLGILEMRHLIRNIDGEL